MKPTTWFTEIESPVGPLRLVAGAAGLRCIDFLASAKTKPAPIDWIRAPGPLRVVADQLRGYFDGTRRHFDAPLDLRGTTFQQSVWRLVHEIPFGQTISYGELAARLGNQGASRAVGLANGQNPLPIVIPCHRVIGKDGTLVGYGGGLAIKERLLALERQQLTLW